MLKKIEKRKGKLIISHIADIDGMASVCLAKTIWPNIDYVLVEFAETKDILEELLDSRSYKNYDEIFITDLSLRNSEIEVLEKSQEFQSKIKHFDHHKTELDKNKYPYVNVVWEKDGKLVSGTSLFYEYLKEKYGMNGFEDFVEAVRSYDTWDWKKDGNIKGKCLTDLFTIFGPSVFIDKYSKQIKESYILKFSDEDLILIKRREDEIKDYIEKCDQNLIITKIENHNVGISLSEAFRSDVGNVLSQKYKDELDYILIINLMRNQYSFRTVRDDINVGEIAKSFTSEAGGHPKAAGAPINNDTIWILNLAVDELKK